MSNSKRRPWLAFGGALMAAAAVSALVVGVHSGLSTAPARRSTVRSDLLRALAAVPGASSAGAATALGNLQGTLPAALQPSCKPDPSVLRIPPAQFPNGQHGLAVPFVAALSNGELLSGYKVGWGVKVHPSYPWALTLKGVSGWVTGLLQIPSLATVIDPTTGFQFCDDTGFDPNKAIATKTSPRLQFALISDSKPADTTQNTQYAPGTAYAPWFFSLKASGAPSLAVTSVDPNGAINLSGTTPAITTVTVWASVNQSGPPFKINQICPAFPGTDIAVGTQGGPEPAGGPPSAPLQFTGAPLTGGVPAKGNANPATATLVGNDFPVAAFPFLLPGGGVCGAAAVLNGGLSGFNKKGLANCSVTCPDNIASPPGWSQFTVKATLAQIELPQLGVPSGFGF